MARSALSPKSTQGKLRIALLVLMLVSLGILSLATQNSARFGQVYLWLLLFNSGVLILLIGLIGHNLWRLISQGRKQAVGSRLTTRMVALFVMLSVAPVTVVYLFSIQFLSTGIDSWFDVRIEQALDDALDLSRASLDLRMRDLLKRSENAADELIDVSDASAPLVLGDLRQRLDAAELTMLGNNGRIIASSSQDPSAILPVRPEENLLSQTRQQNPYVGLDPIGDRGLHVRVLVPYQSLQGPGNQRVLQALYPVSPRLNDLAEDVQQAFGQYREIIYLREPLKQSFMLTLSLVLALTLLFAVWTAFYLARRLVAPIRDLAEGTRAVAEGDYGTQLPPAGRDELGFLVRSFNDMSRRIAISREDAKRSQVQVESQRGYLEAVLGRLSSGVLALDLNGEVRTANQAALLILGLPLEEIAKHPSLDDLAIQYPHFAGFARLVERHRDTDAGEWREEFAFDGPEGLRTLMCSGTRLPGGHGTGGYVVVFDDVTALIQAQRDAAWGEVARRLAHEIKNPLTPIQLAAERIRRRYLDQMQGKDAEVMERATRTIVQQVDAMKDMVNAFSDYARPPRLNLQPRDLSRIVQEVVDLYRSGPDRRRIRVNLAENLPSVLIDAGRVRQLLHNLIKNALEAGEEQKTAVSIATTLIDEGRFKGMVEVCVDDDGPGFTSDVMDQLFDPYVTSKPKGTGLGMAIVKKIVEEHGAGISARNTETGARVVVRFPALDASAPASQIRPLGG